METDLEILKLYQVTNRTTGEGHFSVSQNAEDACTQAGWLIGDCYVVEQKPLAKYDKNHRSCLLVKIPCHVCPYQYVECKKPVDLDCPSRPETPDLKQWLNETSKAHLCPHTGEDLGKRDYQKRLKTATLEQAVKELTPQPSTTLQNPPVPIRQTPLTVI